MRKVFTYILIGLGAFLLTAALLARFYGYDRLAVAPLDEDSIRVSEATDATIFDIASQEEITVDLRSVRKVIGDVDASEAASDELDRQVAIYETSVVNTVPGEPVSKENPPRSATHDRVAFDRHTGEAIDCCDTYLASTADLETGEEVRDTDTPISGQYFKLPFNAQKTTYQFWDGSLKDSTDLVYRGTEKIDGLTVYKYEQVIEATDVGDINAPASIFGIDEEGDVKLDRIYANTRTLWVEPETGVVIRGQEAQHVVAEYQGEEVATLTDALIGYNAKTIASNVDEYSPLATQLKVIRVWLPWGGGIIGALLLVAGLLLYARQKRRSDGSRAHVS